MENRQKPKIIAVIGPTASGKSALAVKLAKKFNGEVVSADSRQVYRGMDLGTGKITRAEMRGVKHHLLDVASPRTIFNVVRYQNMTHRVIVGILARKKLPIICGGTGLYIKAVVENPAYPSPAPNRKLHAQLEKKTLGELFVILKKLDPARAHTIDRHNPRRLVRAIEIAHTAGAVPKVTAQPLYRVLLIGVKKTPIQLKRAIAKRLRERVKKGMMREAARLHAHGVSWKRMEAIGLEYKYLALHLQGKFSKAEMMKTLETKIWQYARRQMTWFRSTKGVRWVRAPREAETLVRSFLKK